VFFLGVFFVGRKHRRGKGGKGPQREITANKEDSAPGQRPSPDAKEP